MTSQEVDESFPIHDASFEDLFSRAKCICLDLNFRDRASAIICLASGDSSDEDAGDTGSSNDRLRVGVIRMWAGMLFSLS